MSNQIITGGKVRFLIIIIVNITLLFGCKGDDLTAPDYFYSAYSPANDLVCHGGMIYFTNYDVSGEEGDQIYLFQSDTSGHLFDRFNLHMNGQGYMSITSDGYNLYLLSERPYGLMLKFTSVGEWIAFRGAEVILRSNGNDLILSPGGIAYRCDTGELIASFMKVNNPYSVSAYFFRVDRETLVLDTEAVTRRHYPGMVSLFSLVWGESAQKFYALSHNTTGSVKLLTLDENYNLLTAQEVADSTRGITIVSGQLLAVGPYRSIFDPR